MMECTEYLKDTPTKVFKSAFISRETVLCRVQC